MNIVKMLEKQKENGKDIILADGNIISKDEIKKANLKTYLAGLKSEKFLRQCHLTSIPQKLVTTSSLSTI